MNSMTGYGRGAASHDALELVVEVSSVNRRSLEMQVSTPKDWTGAERMLNEMIRARAHRGKVYLQVKVREVGGDDGLQWDDASVKAALERLRQLAEETGSEIKPDGPLLFMIASAVKQNSQFPDWTELEDLIREAAREALERWDRMRAGEGSALKADLSARGARLDELVRSIEAESGNTAAEYREKLFERLRQAQLELDVDDERVLKEVAIYADRCDVSEELTRLKSHLAMLRDTLESAGTIGRKIDFILQEVYREFNTIGSKANNLKIGQLVIEGKNEWERLREQSANVE